MFSDMFSGLALSRDCKESLNPHRSAQAFLPLASLVAVMALSRPPLPHLTGISNHFGRQELPQKPRTRHNRHLCFATRAVALHARGSPWRRSLMAHPHPSSRPPAFYVQVLPVQDAQTPEAGTNLVKAVTNDSRILIMTE